MLPLVLPAKWPNLTLNQKVEGSIPSRPTFKATKGLWFSSITPFLVISVMFEPAQPICESTPATPRHGKTRLQQTLARLHLPLPQRVWGDQIFLPHSCWRPQQRPPGHGRHLWFHTIPHPGRRGCSDDPCINMPHGHGRRPGCL